jgi:hypothetical protein
MLYLIWALLNIGLFFYFLVICFKATKLIRERIGLLACVIFVFGLLSFAGGSGSVSVESNQPSNRYKKGEFMAPDSIKQQANRSMSIILEKTFVLNYNLYLQYFQDNESHINIPISASSSCTGLSSGTDWEPVTINVTKTAYADKFEYIVIGEVEWKLLGCKSYTQPKIYRGIVSIKQTAL